MLQVKYIITKPGLTEASFLNDRTQANIGSGYLEKLQELVSAGAITQTTESLKDTIISTTIWPSKQAHDAWTAQLIANPNWTKFKTNLNNMGYLITIVKQEV